MDLLFTLDAGYLEPLKVALTSLHANDPAAAVTVWLIHAEIPAAQLEPVARLTADFGWSFRPVAVDGRRWAAAPTQDRYPKEMYFRLLAGDILPADLHRVLYLDPDILVLNALAPLWQLDLHGQMLAAATHTGLVDVTTPFNNLRLNTDHAYFNSGVLLIDLDQARARIRWADIRRVIETQGDFLMLPDQDILNHLYGKYIQEVPDERWNYDARSYAKYFLRSKGEQDIHWVMTHTAILHFDGQPKPWSTKHDNRFTALYLAYQKLAANLVKTD
ncbi:glycosyltransferase family 8 protein [Lacticaseibacillus parakribbianus]|uniref:glycosyltransferase family 8 protein n=1 Tax=Lacticaseibacillus parakribbianus TaxID=2970927 RepID=UPI0021CAE918|nr:glycosyltransferase family 8 protein [Lacticaseibacillus parakribbianus]